MTSLVLMDTALQQRRRFLGNLNDIVGRSAAGVSNVRACWAATPTEGAVARDAIYPVGNWVYNSTPTGRLSGLGRGAAVSFNGSTEFVSTADRADLSFVSGTDQPFTTN